MQDSDKVMKYLKCVFVGLVVLFGASWADALELRGAMSVNMTSDTSANAKNMALAEARRQIVGDVLRQYVDADAFNELFQTASANDLTALISSVSIDGEQISDTAYSANVSMVVDVDVAQQWLDKNGVQNWLPTSDSQDVFVVLATLSNRLGNWADLNRVAAEQNINLGVKNISGNVVRFELPVSARGSFTIAVRGAGWKYADKDGVLNIWK